MTSVGAERAGHVDLHLHTTASDGLLSPEQLVAAAHEVALSAIAITDHDTLEGVVRATETAAAFGIRIVPGVELSVEHGDREVHILALHLSRPDHISGTLAQFRETRKTRAEEIVRKLNQLGMPLRLESVYLQAGDGAVGRPHIARALIEHGFVRDSREAFDRYLGHGKPAYAPKQRISFAEAIEMTHGAGGIAVWAHPGENANRENLERFMDIGLDGVEVRHPGHSAEDIQRIGALAEHLGLLRSGGSDWHGTQTGPRRLGNMNVPAEWLTLQDERVRAMSCV